MTVCKHEIKYCERCNSSFECKVGDVANCQCYGIEISGEIWDLANEKYNDCLCRNCLLQLQSIDASNGEVEGKI